MTRKTNPDVRSFILKNIEQHPHDLSSMAVEKFGLSRTAINRYMQSLINEGLVEAKGNTKARQYKLRVLVAESIRREIDYLWDEDDLWRKDVFPLMKGQSQNIIDICHYGVTEMVNNVLDHARSPDILLHYEQTYTRIQIDVFDLGIGIFKKIQQDFNYDDPRTALLELSKGRLTSDRKNHAGEGIYFTSRMFDQFNIVSSGLVYSRKRDEENGWLIGIDKQEPVEGGSWIRMVLRTDAKWTTADVFDECQGDTLRFRKTHVPVSLAQYPGEQLVSRSQAKRLLARFDKFSEVFLDFHNVEQIGQPFADEIFRVFASTNPDVSIVVRRANDTVKKMIEFVKSNAPSVHPDLFER